MISSIETCPTRKMFGPLKPVEIIWKWNRFTEKLSGDAALEYLKILNKYLPKDAWDRILDLSWEVISD